MKLFKNLPILMFVNLILNNGKFVSQTIWKNELGYSWTEGCNFIQSKNNDISFVKVEKNLCFHNCKLKIDCSHFIWNIGVCYLKKDENITRSKVNRIKNDLSICGILTAGNFITEWFTDGIFF